MDLSGENLIRRHHGETEGKTQQVAGKIQNAVGGFKDAVEKAVND